MCRPLQDILFGGSSTPLRRSIINAINARFSAVTAPRSCSQKYSINQSNGNYREPVVIRELTRPRYSIGDAASDVTVTTEAKEARQCEKREYVGYESHWSHGGCLISIYLYSMYALTRRGGGAMTGVCAVPKHHKNYILPTMLPPPSWLRAAGPPPQARHLTGRIDKRHNFGDPATVEWQRGDTSQG